MLSRGSVQGVGTWKEAVEDQRSDKLTQLTRLQILKAHRTIGPAVRGLHREMGIRFPISHGISWEWTRCIPETGMGISERE